jgi:ADP-heptose:LPS heptosyltransferase
MPNRTHMTERVLIYRLGSLGDTLVALPAFHLVARAFPHADRRMLTNIPINAKAASAASILEHTGLVHGYFRYVVGMRSPRALFFLWWQLIRWRPQVLIYMGARRGIASAKRDVAFFRLCGIRRIIGAPLTEDRQAPRLIPGPSGERFFESEASRIARNLSELGEPHLEDPATWSLHLTPAEHARAAELLAPIAGRPLLAASIGTKFQPNNWEPQHWTALLARLGTLYPNHALVLTGTPGEFATTEQVAVGWRSTSPNPILNLCGQLTPRETAAVFGHAQLFLGHDSGPMHLAAAVQTPCVAIFSAMNPPGVWYPFGRRNRVLYHRVDCAECGLEVCTVQRKKCILSITVDEVLSEVASLLPPILPILVD